MFYSCIRPNVSKLPLGRILETGGGSWLESVEAQPQLAGPLAGSSAGRARRSPTRERVPDPARQSGGPLRDEAAFGLAAFQKANSTPNGGFRCHWKPTDAALALPPPLAAGAFHIAILTDAAHGQLFYFLIP